MTGHGVIGVRRSWLRDPYEATLRSTNKNATMANGVSTGKDAEMAIQNV